MDLLLLLSLFFVSLGQLALKERKKDGERRELEKKSKREIKRVSKRYGGYRRRGGREKGKKALNRGVRGRYNGYNEWNAGRRRSQKIE